MTAGSMMLAETEDDLGSTYSVMSFETFSAPTLNEAKAAMRARLGEGAVILATRKRQDGMVELRAIRKGMPLFDGEGPASPAPKKDTPRVEPHQEAGKSRPVSGLAARTAKRPDDEKRSTPREGTGLHNKIERSAGESALSALKGDFSLKLGGRGGDPDDPFQREIAQALQPHGISQKLIKALANEARSAHARDLTGMLEHAFARVLNYAPLTLTAGAPIMLVGQTGAGKTSSAAKLAARAAAEGDKAAFLCADVGRAGALDQMTTYASALDTRYWPIEDPQDVENVLREENPREILILDTPGVSPFAPADIAAMRAFRDSLDAEPVLVLPASGDMYEHIDWANAFREIGVRRCIITKFDTSRRVGAALSAAFEGNLALAHFSEAPFIADGLIDASPAYLARRLVIENPARIADTI